LDLNSGAFQRKDLRLFQPTEWVIPSAGFFSKTVECDALVQNGAFFMELDRLKNHILQLLNKNHLVIYCVDINLCDLLILRKK